MLYLVSYDLEKPNASTEDYKPLISALEGQGAKRVLWSEWVLTSTSSAQQVFDFFWKFRSSNEDRLLVTQLSAWYGTQPNFLAPMPTNF
jgi:hypothetical protein